MIKIRSRMLWPFAMVIALLPSSLQAQSIATSFEELQRRVKPGETVVVTDVYGQETKGQIRELSATSLALLERIPRSFLEETITPRSFAEANVARIHRVDSSWNGAVIGGCVGAAVAFAGLGATYRTGTQANYWWGYVGIWLAPAGGAIAGMFIDRAIGGAPVYLAPARASKTSVSISPLLAKGGGGAAVSIRY